MKIGIISTVGGYSWAGSEEMWKLFAVEALNAGHSVAVSANAAIGESQELAEYRRLGGLIFPFQPLNWLMRRLTSKRLHTRFQRMRHWQPDLLCISTGGPADFFWEHDLMTYLTANTCPQVYILQANGEGLVQGDGQREALRELYLGAARVICVSQANARLLERQLAVSLPGIVILPNPIRWRMEMPLPWPDGTGVAVRFGTVARYEIGCKAQDQTLEAFSAVEWKDRNWQLDLFGSGPDEWYLTDLIRHYGLERHVSIKGYERDFRKIWANHHVHILNSRQEGLALALVESMFCGRPAVITRAGGNHELLRDGIDGFISSGMDAEIIGKTLERAWASRAAWKAMGEAAFSRVSEWIPIDLSDRLLKNILYKCPVGGAE